MLGYFLHSQCGTVEESQGAHNRVDRVWLEPPRSEVQSIVAYVLETEFIGRASVEDAEVRYGSNVNLLCGQRHVADRHVFDHALPQRRHLFTHR